MTDWYDEQCLMDGREVPEKIEEERSKSQMEQNEENKGFKGSGIGRGGVFGGPPKAMNAPPPQTSFGATSGTRIGGAFGSQSNGPDGRGTPIGSDDVGGGGGNVVSVGVHRDRSACFSQGGGFGTNRSMTPNSPTSFKNNHEGGRFGTLAPKSTGGAFSSSSSSGDVDKLKIGGSFGSSQNAESTRSSVGGSFGSLRTAHTSSSISRSSIGGAFGSKSSSSDATAKVGSSIGGSFGASRSSNDPPPTVGAGFGSSKSTTCGSVGGSFGSRPKGFASAAAGFRNPVPEEENQSQPIGKVFPTSQVVPTQTWKAVFSPQRPGAGPEELIDQGSWYGVFCGKVGNATGSDVPSDPITGKARNDETATSGSVEVPKNFSASTASFTNAKSSGSSERIGGAFGASRRVTQEIPDLTSPPPPIFGSRSADTKSSATHTVVSETIAGGFFDGSQENRDPTPTGNIADFDRSKSGSSGQVPAENLVLRGGFGAGIGRNAETPTFGGSSRANRSGLQENTSGAPFMGNQQQPQMRGGFQGGYRGGRGSGGQMDFGAGQGHSMGRGRGQPFVPQQRSTPPPFAGPNGPMVTPDPRYKYTKPQADIHDKAPVPADIALLNKFIQKEVINEGNVEVKRDDPKSPLYSISSFRELRLKQEVLEALDILNFQFPTRIQETALPLLLMEPPSNLIAQAQSGTGKTAAFVLTMLCRIDVDLPYPQCICLAPTLELAKQIGEVVEKMGQKVANLRIHYAIKGGNMAAMRGRKLTEQIVIGTPGITRDYLQKYKCIDPSKIRCLVLDEADVMIYHQGFTDISTTIYNMVEEASDSVQSMLFSATYDEPVINFATKIIKNAIVVMLKREEQALPNIKQFYVQCACRDSKYAAIVNLYSGLAVASSVIFCHTKASVMWLFENMKARGHQVDVLHGDMTVVERADTIIRFKQGDFKVLITTNVFARGIDVAQVSVVINYDLPIKYDDTGNPMVIDGFTQPDCETYLHRIGRTGRFGKKGIAINFIDSEDSMNMINVLEKHFQMKITRMDPSNLVELEAIEIA